MKPIHVLLILVPVLILLLVMEQFGQQAQKPPTDEQLQQIVMQADLTSCQARAEQMRRADQKQIDALTAQIKKLTDELDKKGE